MKPNRVLSLIQPTGEMHVGNYFGAIANWARLQESHNCIFGIVDLHTMTMPFDPKVLHANTEQMMVDLLAAGIDSNKATVIVQSLVPEHTELSWIFACLCPMGDLYRMTQFKEKSDQVEEKSGAFISAGLFTYPVLQAADILVYRADKVPVGKDQVQHLELSREIARRFNSQFGNYFPEPGPLLTESAKVMSLADPLKKMSKSLGDKHCIFLFEEEASVRKKVKSAVTDSGDFGTLPTGETVEEFLKAQQIEKIPGETEADQRLFLREKGFMSSGLRNMFELLKACGKVEIVASLQKDYLADTLRYVTLKEAVADAMVELTTGMRAKRAELLKDPEHVRAVYRKGSEKAREIASETLRDVRKMTGLPERKN